MTAIPTAWPRSAAISTTAGETPTSIWRSKGVDQAQNNARKDHNLHPINSDFDLYSSGADGQSSKPLTAGASKDDIIRANNGSFYGYGKDY